METKPELKDRKCWIMIFRIISWTFETWFQEEWSCCSANKFSQCSQILMAPSAQNTVIAGSNRWWFISLTVTFPCFQKQLSFETIKSCLPTSEKQRLKEKKNYSKMDFPWSQQSGAVEGVKRLYPSTLATSGSTWELSSLYNPPPPPHLAQTTVNTADLGSKGAFSRDYREHGKEEQAQ